ncbi:MAG: hypothetical protein IPM29_22120 [Planctomycetes bacterium]|nr:hypothetical protein [Planctomycetota bacterium]
MSRGIVSPPPLRVQLAGTPLDDALAQRLRAAVVRQRLDRPALAELAFGCERGDGTFAPDPGAGATLSIHVGDDIAPLFAGAVAVVDERHGPSGLDELRVTALDALQRLRSRQPVRVHEGLDCAALARELVGELGVTVEYAPPSPVTPRRVQYRQTDLELLQEACADAGLAFCLAGDALQLVPPEGRGTPVVRRIGRDVLTCSFVRDASVAACANVEASGYEPDGRSGVHGAFYDDTDAERDGPFDGVWRLCGELAATSEEACARATAVRDRHAALRSVVEATVEGAPALRPGAVLELEGLGSGHTERFVLTQVTHRFDVAAGYVCEVSSRPVAAARERHRGALLTFGDVTAIDDPDDRGRIRAKLGAFADLDSGWLAVAVPAAGPDKGVCALPDVGDRVLIAFAGRDLAHGIVLGAVWGPHALPEPSAPQSRTRSFTLRTARGQLVELADDGDRLLLTDRTGNRVELSPERLLVEAAVDMALRAPGRKLEIAADRIDFRRV